MQTLHEVLGEADRAKVAIGHFNVSELVVLKAVTVTARAMNVPVLIGVSEGEREFIGVRNVAALVRSLREEYGQPVFLNADHTHSLAKAVDAAHAGFDMIVFDGSALPFETNVRQTKEAVDTVHSINPSIIVEGEIGYIGASSVIHAQVPKDLGPLTTPEQAKEFVDSTGVRVLAPAVGNMHGLLPSMVRGETHKHLDIERIKEIKRATGVVLTLHGGSGTDDNDFLRAIQAGISIVHINTEVRVAWRQGLEAALAKLPNEVAPYKILPGALDAVGKVVQDRLRLFTQQRTRDSAMTA